MNRILFLLVIFCALKANAQNYQITFTGTGATTTVSTVKVENLTKSKSLNLNGSDTLHLTSTTGVNSIEDKQSSELKIYPNPMTDNSTLEILPPVAGNAVITVLDMTGKPVAQIQSYLENYLQKFLLSGIKNGFYLINVKGNNYQFSGKLLSNGKSYGTIKIEKINNITQAVDEKAEKADIKGTQATVDMTYSTGDRLKFTGISGNFSTVITDIPVSDKTINFNFIACQDGDNNNYPVVAIGAQFWMAENLKTTKYNDNTTISPVTDNTAWEALSTPGYCWYNNDADTYRDTYGALYNWYAVNESGDGGKNVCPTGWHVPTDAQWTNLTDYLTNNGYGYQGSGNDIAKSMAATSGWDTYSTAGTIGNDQLSNNSSGFTALPGGYRDYDGVFNYVRGGGCWWSATEYNATYAWSRHMDVGNISVGRLYGGKRYGSSVRCLRDL
jgi:uncharacterized protein (TIGR02145 family)